jgi:hypothetical protein
MGTNTTIHSGTTGFNRYVNTGYQFKYSDKADFTHLNPLPNLYHNDSSNTLVDTGLKEEVYAQFPLFFKQIDLIKIPAKTETAIRKYLPRQLLYEIHPDVDTAIELCLLFLSNLTDTYFRMQSTIDPYHKLGWKNLKSEYIDEQLGDKFNFELRKNIVSALEHGTSKGVIIECDRKYLKGVYSFSYRLGTAYLGKGVNNYVLKTKHVKGLLNKSYYKTLSKCIENPICKNLIYFYGLVELPTKEEILNEAKRLVKEKYKTKKEKFLTFLNNHSKNYFKDKENRSFVSDAIEIFEYLTDNGFMIPRPGDEKSGGRVVDSFTLMPSWIRKLVKINGQNMEECDYTALHPNIAMNLYGGSKEYLKHSEVAEQTGLDKNDVKKEHLSFFNMEVWQMKKNKLYNYYNSTEPKMILNIIEEKTESSNKHKTTSMRMFKLEVDVMSCVIKKLNSESIYVGYIYDALFCSQNNVQRVIQVMNETILEFGIKTRIN